MNDHEHDSLYFAFSQVIRFHHRRTHELLEKSGTYPGQPPLLFILGRQDGLSQKELADKIHIKAATIAVMLKRMEKAKLVERRPDEVDQRISRVYLTEKGKKLRAEALEALKVVEEECFSNFTPEERILLRRFFLQMRDNLEKSCNKT